MDHSARRERLIARLPDLGIEALLVTRLPNVRYLSGFTGSNAQVLLTADSAVLLTDGRYGEQAGKEAPAFDLHVYTGAMIPALGEALGRLEVGLLGFEAAGVTYQTFRRLQGIEGLRLEPTEGEVEGLRWVKDRDEIRLIEAAQALADEAFTGILAKLVESRTEQEVALDLEQSMRALGADAVAFDSIVAFGENAAEPHHRPGPRPLRPGDLVKLDFGCVVQGYASDMTRTVAFGQPDPELREIHDLVRRAQQAGIDALRAGATGAQVDGAARAVIADAGHGERFGHSLGHGIGLEVHEGPTLRKESEDRLPEGTVVTVEPGVYLPGRGGVRIEDMVEVTEGGSRPLPGSSRDLIVV
ncbi:MAG TPA: aminopeptidase P family protein [Actinomycetota bacterium]